MIIPHDSIKRSDTSASSTVPDPAPDLAGSVAVDCAGKVWRYQLDPFITDVTLNIHHMEKAHYPAPTPTDDTGELTNVNRGNCKGMVENLHRYRSDVHRVWSAYRRDHLHEGYHCGVEWRDAMNCFVPMFESSVEKIGVPFANAATAADAEMLLAPAVKNVHSTAYAKVWNAFTASSDKTGEDANLAQAPAIDFLVGRIVKYGIGKKWLLAGYVPGKNADPGGPPYESSTPK